MNYDVDLEADVTIDFNTDIDFDKNVDIDIFVDTDLDLEGNFASLTFDVQAAGTNVDTLAEADVFVLAIEDTLSSVGGSMVAAVE